MALPPEGGKRRVLRWDPYLEPNEDDMEFRLTYSGSLLAHRTDKRLAERSLHVHAIRKQFHAQLKNLWQKHANLRHWENTQDDDPIQRFAHDGFLWQPLVTKDNGLICKIDMLMLREGEPGSALYDLDNRLKTVFDALRMATGPSELGLGTAKGQQQPTADEQPFYVLLQCDSLITHVSVSSDTLLEPVPGVPNDDAVRLVISVSIRPYKVHMENLIFAA